MKAIFWSTTNDTSNPFLKEKPLNKPSRANPLQLHLSKMLLNCILTPNIITNTFQLVSSTFIVSIFDLFNFSPEYASVGVEEIHELERIRVEARTENKERSNTIVVQKKDMEALKKEVEVTKSADATRKYGASEAQLVANIFLMSKLE